jgi:hypothetical protein
MDHHHTSTPPSGHQPHLAARSPHVYGVPPEAQVLGRSLADNPTNRSEHATEEGPNFCPDLLPPSIP